MSGFTANPNSIFSVSVGLAVSVSLADAAPLAVRTKLICTVRALMLSLWVCAAASMSRLRPTSLVNSLYESIVLPLTAMMRSPFCKPIFCAMLPATMLSTSAGIMGRAN